MSDAPARWAQLLDLQDDAAAALLAALRPSPPALPPLPPALPPRPAAPLPQPAARPPLPAAQRPPAPGPGSGPCVDVTHVTPLQRGAAVHPSKTARRAAMHKSEVLLHQLVAAYAACAESGDYGLAGDVVGGGGGGGGGVNVGGGGGVFGGRGCCTRGGGGGVRGGGIGHRPGGVGCGGSGGSGGSADESGGSGSGGSADGSSGSGSGWPGVLSAPGDHGVGAAAAEAVGGAAAATPAAAAPAAAASVETLAETTATTTATTTAAAAAAAGALPSPSWNVKRRARSRGGGVEGREGMVGSGGSNKVARWAGPRDWDWTVVAATAVGARQGAAQAREMLIGGSVASVWRGSQGSLRPPGAAGAAGRSRNGKAAAIASRRGSSTFARSVASLPTLPDCSGGESGMESGEGMGPARSNPSDRGPARSNPSDSGGDGGGGLSSNEELVPARISCLGARADGQHRNHARRKDLIALVQMSSNVSRHLLDEAANKANQSKVGVREELKAELKANQDSMTMAERSRQRARREAAVSRASKLAYAQELEALVDTLVKGNLEILEESRIYREMLGIAPRDRQIVSAGNVGDVGDVVKGSAGAARPE